MFGSTPYAAKFNAAYDGTATPHPDVSIGSGVDVALTAIGGGGTMAALHTGMTNFYSREALHDSDVTIINVGPEFGLISFYRDFSLSRFWSMLSVRSETVSGTQRLRFMSKQDTRLCTFEQALLSVGYPGSGLLTDSYEVGTDISTLNKALFAARVYMAAWRAWSGYVIASISRLLRVVVINAPP